MDIENLVTMANKIGDFYETMPNRPEAMHDVADHIKKFWDPRMRRALLAYIDQDGQHEYQLTPLVNESIRLHRATL